MPIGGKAVRAFHEYAARPPARWRKVAAVVLAILLPVLLWQKRGAAVAIVAFLVYGGVLGTATFRHRETMAWSRRHPVLDAVLTFPVVFLALAYMPWLSLAACIAIALVAGVVLIGAGVWPRRTG